MWDEKHTAPETQRQGGPVPHLAPTRRGSVGVDPFGSVLHLDDFRPPDIRYVVSTVAVASPVTLCHQDSMAEFALKVGLHVA